MDYRPLSEMSRYEADQLHRIALFLDPPHDRILKVYSYAGAPFRYIGKRLAKSRLTPAFDVVLRRLNVAATWSVRSSAIYAEFRTKDHDVSGPGAVHQLDLEQVDRVVRGLAAKYFVLGNLEGALFGAMGPAGLAFDIPALVSLSLRCVAEHAVYYGFDPADEAEKRYMLTVLMLATAEDREGRQQALEQANAVAGAIAQVQAAKEVMKAIPLRVLAASVAESTSRSIAKATLGKAIPLAGAIAGAGANAGHLLGVAYTARRLYRLRFLLARYGPEVLTLISP